MRMDLTEQRILEQTTNVVIMGHNNPDLDSVTSEHALMHVLRSLKPTIWNNYKKYSHYVPYSELKDKKDIDFIILVDHHDIENSQLECIADKVVGIFDSHITDYNENYIKSVFPKLQKSLTVVEQAAGTAAVIWRYAERLKLQMVFPTDLKRKMVAAILKSSNFLSLYNDAKEKDVKTVMDILTY